MNASSRSMFCFALLALLPACAIYEEVEFGTEIASLRRNLPPERLWMNGFEKEPWQRGYAAGELNQDVVEYVRASETVENWTELLTMKVVWRTSKPYTYPGGQTFSEVPDPAAIMEATRISAQERCSTPVTLRQLDEDRTGAYPSVMFYLAYGKLKNAADSPTAVESDVFRVFRGKHGLHMVIRARRASSLDEATLAEWTRYMKRFYVCDNTVPGQECGKKPSP